MSDKSLGRILADHVVSISYEKLPEKVVETIKRFTLDTLGVIVAAAGAPGMAGMQAALTEWETDGRATLLLSGKRVSPVTAVLGNSSAAHSLDFDDCHDPSRVHAFCVLVPAVLAAAEAKGNTSGKDAITALTVGAEVFCRLGSTCYNCMDLGWHPTTTLGNIAAAAAVSKLWGLNSETTMNAMALAFVQMGGSTQFMADKVLAKRAGPGFAARSGVQAAQLAKHDITGPYRFLEGDSGLFKLYQKGEVKPEILLDDWQKTWRLLELSMKPWPCCRCTHTIIQLALQLRERGIKPEDIEGGTISLGKVNQKIVGANFDQTHPNPTVHAQFNACYTFAIALADGTVTIESFTPKLVQRESVAWAERLRCITDKDIPDTAMQPAKISLTLKNGEKVDIASDTMKGSPENPMSREEVLDKFRRNLAAGWNTKPSASGPLEHALLDLDHQESIDHVIKLILDCRT